MLGTAWERSCIRSRRKWHPFPAKVASVTGENCILSPAAPRQHAGGVGTGCRRCCIRFRRSYSRRCCNHIDLCWNQTAVEVVLLAPTICFAGTELLLLRFFAGKMVVPADDGGELDAAALKMLQTTTSTRWNQSVGEVQSSPIEAGTTGGRVESRRRWRDGECRRRYSSLHGSYIFRKDVRRRMCTPALGQRALAL